MLASRSCPPPTVFIESGGSRRAPAFRVVEAVAWVQRFVGGFASGGPGHYGNESGGRMAFGTGNRRKCGRRHDEQVKEEPKTREPNHDRRNRTVDLPEVPGECESQKDQCALEDQRQGLHDEVEFPGLNPVSFLSRTLLLSAVDPRVSFCLYRLSHCFPSMARNDAGEWRTASRRGCIEPGR
jgi:hypothetical protein